MSRHHDELYLRHIEQAATKISRRIQGISRAAFDEDEEKQDGLIRQLEIIGEAASQISEGYRAAHPAVDWRKMKDLRNVLIHGYANVNLDRVWEVVRYDIPRLHQQLWGLLRSDEIERDD